MAITIDPEFRKLIAPLSRDEYAQLEENLVRDGCRDPLVTWGSILLDGHNRYEICSRRGIRFAVKPIAFPDRLDARIWIRRNQLGRRNLTDDMRAVQVAGLVADLTAQSKRARASAAGKAGGRNHPAKTFSLRDNTDRKLKNKSGLRPRIAKREGVSERKVKQVQTLQKRAPDLVEKVAGGELKLKDAIRQTKPATRAARLAATVWPDGKYGVLLADPPWRPEIDAVIPPDRKIENQYPTMPLADMIALRPKIDAIALPACVLVLWTVSAKLAEAVALVDGWGFTVKSGAVWIKNSIGMGYWFRQRHELIIVATRGTPLTPLEADRPDSVITAPRAGHSEKPDEVYALLERMFPTIPKAELFARTARDGWDVMTNETIGRSA